MPTFRFTTSGPRYAFGRPWTPGVKTIILITAAVFLLQQAFQRIIPIAPLTLQIPELYSEVRFWQPFTYLFLHNDFWHLAFNLLTLWLFGSDVEDVMGTARFYWYYLICGIGAGLCVSGIGWLAHEHTQTLGASGAIFGILLAFGILYAERVLTLLLFLVFPVQLKAKTMVLLFCAIEFFAGVGNAFGRVSHLAHLSGLGIGLLYFFIVWPEKIPSFNFWQRFLFWRASRHVRPLNPDAELDTVLDKISKKGMQSLTRRERETLKEAARHRNQWPGSN